MKKIISIVLLIGMSFNALADKLIIPMDATQKNHLKAYGIAYWVLEQQERFIYFTLLVFTIRLMDSMRL